jgi:hypothetical protein
MHHLHSTQTLTSLDLARNKLGDERAHYLANVLQTNTVRSFLFSLVMYLSFSFDVDTQNLGSLSEQNQHSMVTLFA